jgi:hypothetical protein
MAVDDHEVVRDGIKLLLADNPDVVVCAEDGTADRPASEAAVGEREVARGRHGSDRGGAAAGAATMCAISVARRGSRPGDAAQ